MAKVVPCCTRTTPFDFGTENSPENITFRVTTYSTLILGAEKDIVQFSSPAFALPARSSKFHDQQLPYQRIKKAERPQRQISGRADNPGLKGCHGLTIPLMWLGDRAAAMRTEALPSHFQINRISCHSGKLPSLLKISINDRSPRRGWTDG